FKRPPCEDGRCQNKLTFSQNSDAGPRKPAVSLRALRNSARSENYFFLRRDLFAATPLRAAAVLLIANSSSLCPCLTSAVSQRGRAPRPAQVSPSGLRNFGATLRPFIGLVRRPEPQARRGRPTPLLSVPRRDSSCSSSLRFWPSRLSISERSA